MRGRTNFLCEFPKACCLEELQKRTIGRQTTSQQALKFTRNVLNGVPKHGRKWKRAQTHGSKDCGMRIQVDDVLQNYVSKSKTGNLVIKTIGAYSLDHALE